DRTALVRMAHQLQRAKRQSETEARQSADREVDAGAPAEGAPQESPQADLFAEMPSGPIWEKGPSWEEVRSIVSRSDTLVKQWRALKADGWKFQFYNDDNTDDDDTYTDRLNKVIKFGKYGPKHHDIRAVIKDIAHELGHPFAPEWDKSSRESYIVSGLDQEGAALLNEFKVRAEIGAKFGIDILFHQFFS